MGPQQSVGGSGSSVPYLQPNGVPGGGQPADFFPPGQASMPQPQNYGGQAHYGQVCDMFYCPSLHACMTQEPCCTTPLLPWVAVVCLAV